MQCKLLLGVSDGELLFEGFFIEWINEFTIYYNAQFAN